MVREESQRMHVASSINRGENNDSPREAGEDVSRERGSMVTSVTRFRIKLFFTVRIFFPRLNLNLSL